MCSGIENARIFPIPNAIKQNESIRTLVLWLKLIVISDQITVTMNISARRYSGVLVSGRLTGLNNVMCADKGIER